MASKYLLDAQIFYNDGSRTELSELEDDAKVLRKAFHKRQTVEVKTGVTGYQLIDMKSVHNIRLIKREATK